MPTFARACPVSLSQKPLSPDIEATPKTDLSLSRSLVHRQTWRLTGIPNVINFSITPYFYVPNVIEKYVLLINFESYIPLPLLCR